MELVSHWAPVVVRAGLVAVWLMVLGHVIAHVLTKRGDRLGEDGKRIPGDW